MNCKLTVYTDDTFTEIDRVVEADGLKIPYRTSMIIIKTLEDVDMQDSEDLTEWFMNNIELLDKIVKATFHVSNAELDCIDAIEMVAVAKELYQWTIEKIKGIRGDSSKKLKKKYQ